LALRLKSCLKNNLFYWKEKKEIDRLSQEFMLMKHLSGSDHEVSRRKIEERESGGRLKDVIK
jgi:hypothetical protein